MGYEKIVIFYQYLALSWKRYVIPLTPVTDTQTDKHTDGKIVSKVKRLLRNAR